MSSFSNEVVVSNFPADNALTDTQLRASPVSVSSTPVTSNSSTVTQISSTGANQTLLAANANRKKAILHFTNGTWYVKFGTTASSTSRTYVVPNTAFDIEVTMWTGQIDAFCTSSGKLVDVTELV